MERDKKIFKLFIYLKLFILSLFFFLHIIFFHFLFKKIKSKIKISGLPF